MWPMPSVLLSQLVAIDAMEKEKEEADTYPIWVDWEKRVISFQEAPGFEKLEYPTHRQMFEFAIEKGYAGFGIQ